MKTKYKYIYFEEATMFGEDYWKIKNGKTKETLGIITYYFEWKQWELEGNTGCIFNNGCLLDIIDFIKQQTNG